MKLILELAASFVATLRDVLPILLTLVFFQLVVLRQPLPNPRRLFFGSLSVLIGLTLFLFGLERALFPIGRVMALQLVELSSLSETALGPHGDAWHAFLMVYAFAALIGFSTTIAEPSLIAVALKAEQVSRGGVHQLGLRIAVGIGVAIGLVIGTFRIVTGTPLFLYMAAGYLIVVLQTVFAPKDLVPLAYDSGGVTTSTITVPLVAALGLGLADAIPGRNPAFDGFGLIAFASLFAVITVMGYTQIAAWWTAHRTLTYS